MNKEYFEAISHKAVIEMATLLHEENRIYKDIIKEVASRTCESCKLFRDKDKACFLSSQNVYIRPACIDFSGCGKWEQK